MSEHYTATIKITKTKTTLAPPASFNTRDQPRSEGSRDVREVANLTIRADSIEALTKKAASHLDLVEDIAHGD